jgi:DNA-binding SARP family transcriptional activator
VHVAEGNVTEALRAYEQFRSLLAEELGVQPSEQMAGLVHEVRARTGSSWVGTMSR